MFDEGFDEIGIDEGLFATHGTANTLREFTNRIFTTQHRRKTSGANAQVG